ncbi:MAG: hypothetical protein EXS38_08530 [Opitutus sp.]|nr:hypothetical protein [Opitutus sp.]
MPTSLHAFAVLDGALCQLTTDGRRLRWHPPLATAVLEFRQGPLCFFVREHPHGLLPGLPNLYCLDGGFRLQWMAEWPNPDDPCAGLVSDDGATLVAVAASGAIVQLDAHSGRLRQHTLAVAAAS